MSKAFPSVLPCGLCGTWVSSACTRGLQLAYYVTVSSTEALCGCAEAYGVCSTIFCDLFPDVQPSETRFLRRKPAEVSGRVTNVDSWCHCGYASGLSYHSMRCDQDPAAGRGAEGRGYLQRSQALCADSVARGRVQGIFQGRPSSHHAIFTTIWLHVGRIRALAAR